MSIPEITLGRTGLKTTKLALGAYGWGGLGPQRTQLVGDDAILALLTAAFAAGVKCIHTAEAYENEDILGRLIPQANPPKDLLVFTKFGHGKGLTGDQFRRSAERTLKELNLQKIPLMFVHDPRDEDDMKAVMGPGGSLDAMRKLQSEGLLDYVGVATGTLKPLEMAVESGEFDVIQFPRLYTLLNPTAKTSGLLENARKKNIGTVSCAPFMGGILATGTANGYGQYNYAEPLPEIAEAVDKMEAKAAEYNATLCEAALAYNYTEPLVDQVVPGMVTLSELWQNVAAFDSKLTREDVEAIAAAGAIDTTLVGGPDFRTGWPPDRRPSRPQVDPAARRHG